MSYENVVDMQPGMSWVTLWFSPKDYSNYLGQLVFIADVIGPDFHGV